MSISRQNLYVVRVVFIAGIFSVNAQSLNSSPPAKLTAVLPDAGKFAFVGEAGGGVRIFTSERRAVTLGVRFHHLSNGDRSGANRGLNNFVIYGGFSIFR
jgi:hypothetical protein